MRVLGMESPNLFVTIVPETRASWDNSKMRNMAAAGKETQLLAERASVWFRDMFYSPNFLPSYLVRPGNLNSSPRRVAESIGKEEVFLEGRRFDPERDRAIAALLRYGIETEASPFTRSSRTDPRIFSILVITVPVWLPSGSWAGSVMILPARVLALVLLGGWTVSCEDTLLGTSAAEI